MAYFYNYPPVYGAGAGAPSTYPDFYTHHYPLHTVANWHYAMALYQHQRAQHLALEQLLFEPFPPSADVRPCTPPQSLWSAGSEGPQTLGDDDDHSDDDDDDEVDYQQLHVMYPDGPELTEEDLANVVKSVEVVPGGDGSAGWWPVEDEGPMEWFGEP